MINFFSKRPSVGDKVRYISNSNSSSYTIGRVYEIHYDGGGTYLLADENGIVGNNAAYQDIVLIKPTKIKDILDEINLAKEFLEDYEGDEITNSMNKEFKAFKILKTIKSEKSDFEKMKIISEFVK